MAANFTTNPVSLEELLKDCGAGEIQLPDFQRSWVWDDDRIRGLIASISQAFPIGALMALETGGDVEFKPRPVQGAPEEASKRKPTSLLLDGQQRMTSLYQTALRREVVETVTARQVKVKRWYYIDIRQALDPDAVREDAIVGLPEDRKMRSNFGKAIDKDMSTAEGEYAHLMFPVLSAFDWDAWQDGFRDYWEDRDSAIAKLFKPFKDRVLQNFKSYQVPVITLNRSTSREAVCLVFEKVNTGGKALDAFELVTAMYASKNFELRKDWFARQARLIEHKSLLNVGATEFLQAISLLYTKAVRIRAEAEGREPPAVSATRQSLLRLPLEAYQSYAPKVDEGYQKTAKFLRGLRIYRTYDLPYQSQLTPLAAILAELPDSQWENAGVREKLVRWFWNGVFGELYGSTVDSRFAKDVLEVPAWLAGGAIPTTIAQATIRADRLRSLRSRLSAAYKGVNALLMRAGAQDFRSGQNFDDTVFFDESVDIHHVFPKDWCAKQKIPPSVYDSIINKTPLTARTNRIIGGAAPSAYLAKLEVGSSDAPALSTHLLDGHLRSHLIEPELLRADSFAAFIAAREQGLLALIEKATGQSVYRGDIRAEREEDAEPSPEDAVRLMAAE